MTRRCHARWWCWRRRRPLQLACDEHLRRDYWPMEIQMADMTPTIEPEAPPGG